MNRSITIKSAIHTELDIGNSQRGLLLVLEVLQDLGQKGGDLALNDGRSLFNSGSGAVELLEVLQLEATRKKVSTAVDCNQKIVRQPRGVLCLPRRAFLFRQSSN